MSKVSPSRFEAKSSRKMDSSSPQKGESFFSPYLLFLCPLLPLPFPSALFSNKENGGLGVAAILMRSCFAWLVITEWFNPLLVKALFLNATVFLLGFFCTDMKVFLIGPTKGCEPGEVWRAPSNFLSQHRWLWMYNYYPPVKLLDRSICEIRKEGEEMKGEQVRVVISISTLQLICCDKYRCFLCWTVKYVSNGKTWGAQKSCKRQ